MDRIERIRLLLLTLNDYLPSIKGSSFQTEPGFVNIRREYECEDCSLNGFISSACSTCGGSGRVYGPTKDPYDTGANMPFAGPTEQRRRDEARLRDSQLARASKRDESDSYVWERRHDAYDRAGSYRELRSALSLLKEKDLMLYRIVHSRYLDNVEKKTICTRLETQALEELSNFMPRRIRVPIWILKERRAIEEDSLVNLLARGFSTRKIALRLGLSQRRVKKLVKRQKKRAA